MNCVHGWPWNKPITIPGVPPQMCCSTKEKPMTDQHFVTANLEDHTLDPVEEAYLQEIADAEFDEFYEQEQERDQRAREKAEEAAE